MRIVHSLTLAALIVGAASAGISSHASAGGAVSVSGLSICYEDGGVSNYRANGIFSGNQRGVLFPGRWHRVGNSVHVDFDKKIGGGYRDDEVTPSGRTPGAPVTLITGGGDHGTRGGPPFEVGKSYAGHVC